MNKELRLAFLVFLLSLSSSFYHFFFSARTFIYVEEEKVVNDQELAPLNLAA